MKQLLLVFLGGGLGSVLRYFLSKTLNPLFSNFFLGTFMVNVFGCFLLGLLLGLSLKNNAISENQTLLLATGFCGGFTTFSTFALENHSMLKSGDLLYAAFYILFSLVLGIVAVYLGVCVSKYL